MRQWINGCQNGATSYFSGDTELVSKLTIEENEGHILCIPPFLDGRLLCCYFWIFPVYLWQGVHPVLIGVFFVALLMLVWSWNR